ncbi:MAG: DUF192 domain-containing protein [Acetobacteraceae bacterium]
MLMPVPASLGCAQGSRAQGSDAEKRSRAVGRRRLLAVSALIFSGLGPASYAQTATEPTGPQPKLPTEELVITGAGGARHVFHVEVARTPEQQITGLMFRKSVAADGGMLFPWGRPIESKMWMKNTLIPLDMVFIKADGTIGHIAEETVPESLAIVSSDGPVVATLELKGGITGKLGILVGDHVQSQALGTAPAP